MEEGRSIKAVNYWTFNETRLGCPVMVWADVGASTLRRLFSALARCALGLGNEVKFSDEELGGITINGDSVASFGPLMEQRLSNLIAMSARAPEGNELVKLASGGTYRVALGDAIWRKSKHAPDTLKEWHCGSEDLRHDALSAIVSAGPNGFSAKEAMRKAVLVNNILAIEDVGVFGDPSSAVLSLKGAPGIEGVAEDVKGILHISREDALGLLFTVASARGAALAGRADSEREVDAELLVSAHGGFLHKVTNGRLVSEASPAGAIAMLGAEKSEALYKLALVCKEFLKMPDRDAMLCARCLMLARHAALQRMHAGR